PFSSFGQQCSGSDEPIAITFIAKDEFGEKTSVARAGGTLEITCAGYGKEKPVLRSGAKQVNLEDMDYKGDGEFLFKINSEFASKYRKKKFECACGGGDDSVSKDGVFINEVLCSPQDTACPDGARHCRLQANGTGKCGGSENICVEGTQTPPVSAFQMVVESKTAITVKKSCQALTEENIEKWGQVELKVATLPSDFRKGSCT
ncbi:MAG: hypothetical protein GY696_19325, partial [Gammaproteobacteria bacterium]|nr:hypothetical protein [Gammaproteobacteria bacterium]